MEITVSTLQGRGPITVMHIKGNLDGSNYQQFQTQAEDLVKDGKKELVLDLSETKFISSAGLRAIHSIFNMLRSEEADVPATNSGIRDGSYKSRYLKVLNPRPEVEEMFKTFGYDMFIDIHKNLESAIASF